MNPIKVAVVGVGSIGGNHARVLANRDDVELIGVCDPHEANAARVSHRHRVPAFDGLESLLAVKKPDAVVIAVPTVLHHRVAGAAIRAGIHVLLEKPMATSVQQSREITELAKRHHVQLLVGHIERYNPAIQSLQQRLRDHEIGELYRVEVDRAGPFPARISDVGVALDLAVHDLDIISSLLGAMPERVYARSQQLLHHSHEDAIVGLINYPGDILAVLNVNWTTPVKKRELRVYGRKGLFRVNYLTQELFLFHNPAQASVENGWGPLGITEGDMIRYNLAKEEPLAREIDFFLNAVRNRVDLSQSVADSITALHLSQCLVQSAQQGEAITVQR